MLSILEATPGFEPGRQSFADSCLTTWLCRRILSNVTQQALFYHNKIHLSILNLHFNNKIQRKISTLIFYASNRKMTPLFLIPHKAPNPQRCNTLKVRDFGVIILFLKREENKISILHARLFKCRKNKLYTVD